MRLIAPLVLLGLACGRATRLMVNDAWPFKPLREWLKENHKGSWPQKLLTCPWCLSGWLTGGSCAALWALQGLPQPPLAWFGAWWLAVASYWLTEGLAKYGAPDDDPPNHLGEMDFK